MSGLGSVQTPPVSSNQTCRCHLFYNLCRAGCAHSQAHLNKHFLMTGAATYISAGPTESAEPDGKLQHFPEFSEVVLAENK